MERTDPPPRGTTWRRRILALLASLVVSLLLAELAVRVLVGAPRASRLPVMEIRANPQRGWEMIPGENHYTYQHEVRINALGLRGREVGPKQAGVVRVLCVGDSLVYGQGVGDAETVPAYLEAALNARGAARFETVNAGHRAYDTPAELGLVEELGAAIDPDVVVLFWYWNDLDERDPTAVHERLRERGRIAFDTNARIEGWEWWRWQGVELLRKSALLMLVADVVRAGSLIVVPDAARVEAAMERQAGYLDRFVALARERGWQFRIAIVPDPTSIEVDAHPTRAIDARLTELATARGIDVLHLGAAVRAVCDELGHVPTIPFDGHYEPPANRAMGEAVARWLVRSE